MFPKRFFDRPKMGFSVPLARWLREDLRGECYGKICGGALGRIGWIRADTARTLLDEHCSGRRDWSAQIWNLLVLAEWAEAASV
jgi:asparagine synthase (glutamine-hydrolysing)